MLLIRVQKHENQNVVKNCTLAMIQSADSNRLFQKYPDLVYGQVVKLLGLGCHYLDCFFHMDSKVYTPISQFFMNYFDQTLPVPLL